jgi:hypothetical protein
MVAMLEPGVDRHEWESEWQALEEQLAVSPGETLPELDDLVGRMLDARGFAIADPVAAEGEEREVVAEFLAARETTTRLESGANDVSPGDVGAAVNGYRSVFQHVIAELGAP